MAPTQQDTISLVIHEVMIFLVQSLCMQIFTSITRKTDRIYFKTLKKQSESTPSG